MENIIFILIGAAIGMMIQYLITTAAVKNGVIDALLNLKFKQNKDKSFICMFDDETEINEEINENE